MIFDPALAAAARRHARALAKSQRSATQDGSSSITSTSPSSFETSLDATSGGGGGASQEAAIGAGGTAAIAPSDSSEYGGTNNAVKAIAGRGERARSTSSSLGDVPAIAGALNRTVNGVANGGGGDLEGATRVGPVVSRSRTMKPRVLLKIVVLGCSNVGKTSLMKRYAANDFTENRQPTIGADFMTKEIVAGDQPMLLQVWDTAGQERFHGGSLGSGFFRGANAALLVYDVACAVSFEQVAMWREELLVRLDVDPHDFPIVVIGNKVDLANGLPMDGVHGVDKTRVLKWCEMQGMGHIETSAKDGTGVEVAMQAVAMLALDQKHKRDRDLALNPSLGGGTTLDLADERARQQRTGGCCW